MRIITGIAGGRKIKVPDGQGVRPTSDKVRGAIFNALRARGVVEGAAAMDVCCGSGALGLEALSQGAASCLFIDNDRTSLSFAKENAAALGLEGASFLYADARKMKARGEQAAAGLLFLDPPYRKNIVPRALEALHEGGWLAPGAFCVVETEKNFTGEIAAAYKMLDEKFYGDTKVLFLHYEG